MGRRLVAAGVVVVLAAAATGTGWWLRRHPGATPAAADVHTATATVVRTDLSSTTQVGGSLGYSGSYTVVAQGAGGTVTALPARGQVITRGQQVYELNNKPVRLFYAARPAWRPLGAGVSNGPDVLALEQNLVALGHATAQNLPVDDKFTQATAAAVRRWQLATHQQVTGRVDLGAVTYQPGPIRVTTATAKLSSAVGGDAPVFDATSTTAVVTVAVPAAQTYLIHVGDAVTVTLPAGNTTAGRVASISTVANVPADSNGGPQSGPAQPTVPAIVTLDKPEAAANLDQAPVTVNITSEAVTGVLAVPITALVALAGGGYGVYVRDGAQRHLVGVTPGLYASTLVQVTGDGVHEGDLVEVPAT